jgi:hypothetical protein
MSEKPGGTSAPSNSTWEGGTVPVGVTVSVAGTVAVNCGGTVTVETNDVAVGDAEGGSAVLVPGWQAASIITINTKTLFNTFSYSPIVHEQIILILQIDPFRRFFHRSPG